MGAAPDCKHCAGNYSSFCHRTSRSCSSCGDAGVPLVDTIVNFGENLHRPVIEKALAVAAEADLCIILGSSARVHPASQVPELAGKCAIVNLCPTAADDLPKISGLPERIGTTTDYAMVTICKELGIEIPEISAEQTESIAADAHAATPKGIAMVTNTRTPEPKGKAKGKAKGKPTERAASASSGAAAKKRIATKRSTTTTTPVQTSSSASSSSSTRRGGNK